ncbi:dihydroorotate oxidase [Weissella halotolerans]|uniref:dihydroorotate oxidase (fumarate) n=1 Tax=Weissella halotolerans DSM 20190 TaxID=1123500 RepID=A0A0R2FYP2_9LACO|nr:dihydroorotate oxidase [Weissella halotolerans]KRN33296.1 dihydroorotate dehydrogenase A [Weissella halotolerans DSM 20190]
MTNLTASIAGFHFQDLLLNAAGVHCETTEELEALRKATGTGALITKSATPKPRPGNSGLRYQDLPLGSINSMGLPNQGLSYYLDYANHYHDQQKPLFLSIAGLTQADNLAMLADIQASEFTGLVELNLSCPNVPGKPQTGYDFEATRQILTKAFTFFTKPLGVKLPPYFDLAHFDQIAAILNAFPLAYVNSINSVGNGLMIDSKTDTVMIAPKGGFGGLGGAMVKATALANVHGLRQRLNPTIKVIGTGGVQSGRDVYDLILAGADLVAVGTSLHQEGPAVFQRLRSELIAEMDRKNYTEVDQFRNRLQTLN